MMSTSRSLLHVVRVIVALLSLVLAGGVHALAHEGEDHGATPTASPGSDHHAQVTLSHPAHIHGGSCERSGPALLYTLTNVRFPTAPNGTPSSAEAAGTAAIPVMTSETKLNVALSDLLAGDHTIDIHADAEQTQIILACGAIGGTPRGDDLYVGLQAQSGSGHAGIAWLHQNEDGTTTVTLFLAHGLAGTEHHGSTPGPGLATPESSPTTGDVGKLPTEVTVELVDIAFDPSVFAIPARTDVTVHLTNTGVLPHTFTIDALGIDVELAPGQAGEITVNAPAGTYAYYCAVPGHKAAGMVGTLTVQ